jgi:hypothetical protein
MLVFFGRWPPCIMRMMSWVFWLNFSMLRNVASRITRSMLRKIMCSSIIPWVLFALVMLLLLLLVVVALMVVLLMMLLRMMLLLMMLLLTMLLRMMLLLTMLLLMMSTTITITTLVLKAGWVVVMLFIRAVVFHSMTALVVAVNVFTGSHMLGEWFLRESAVMMLDTGGIRVLRRCSILCSIMPVMNSPPSSDHLVEWRVAVRGMTSGKPWLVSANEMHHIDT